MYMFIITLLFQGGECDLQDQSMAFGGDRSRFEDMSIDGKRFVKFFKLINTNYTSHTNSRQQVDSDPVIIRAEIIDLIPLNIV